MKAFFLAAFVTIASTGFSQNVSNKLYFVPGQKLEVTTETKKTAGMELMGQQMESVINSTMTEIYDIKKTGPEGTTIEYKVKRLVFNVSGGMGGDQSFDSEKDADRKGELGKMLEKGLKNKYTMTVDQYGNITSIKADDDNPNGKKSENDDMMKMMSTQLGIGLGLPKVGDATLFKLLPTKEVAKNDSWTDSSAANGTKRNTVYKLSGVNDDNLVLDYTENMQINTTQEMMGVQATVKSTDNTAGQILIDAKTGLLKQKTYTIDSKGTLEGQGMTIPSSGKTTITVTVKAYQ